MRTETKLGMVVAAGVIVVAGWYFASQDQTAAPFAARSNNASDEPLPLSRETWSTPMDDHATRDRSGEDTAFTMTEHPSAEGSRFPELFKAEVADRHRDAAGPAPQTGVTDPNAAATTGSMDETAAGATNTDAAAQRRESVGGSFRRDHPPSTEARPTGGDETGNRSGSRQPAAAGEPEALGRSAERAARPSAPQLARSSPTPVPPLPAGGQRHTIAEGDSFALLAEVYYGSQRYTQLLIDANPQVTSPNKLHVGTVLNIPPRTGSARSPGDDRVSRPPSGAGYLVQRGDTLFAIAARRLGSGARWREVYELNRTVIGDRPEDIRPGQRLRMPPR